jgi:hypothetical protein
MKTELGDAFNIEDYAQYLTPDGEVNVEWVKEQFVFEVEYGTVSGKDDIRAQLTDVDREIIAEQITAQNNEKFAKAQKNLIVRLHECVVAIHERLSDTENIFRDSLIGNIEDLCDLIPAMNIGDDPEINDLAAQAKKDLCHWAPEDIRENSNIRKNVAEDAEKLLDKMDGLI